MCREWFLPPAFIIRWALPVPAPVVIDTHLCNAHSQPLFQNWKCSASTSNSYSRRFFPVVQTRFFGVVAFQHILTAPIATLQMKCAWDGQQPLSLVFGTQWTEQSAAGTSRSMLDALQQRLPQFAVHVGKHPVVNTAQSCSWCNCPLQVLAFMCGMAVSSVHSLLWCKRNKGEKLPPASILSRLALLHFFIPYNIDAHSQLYFQ